LEESFLKYTVPAPDPVHDSIQPLVEALGMNLVEFTVSRHRGGVHVRAVVARKDGGSVGTLECSRVHHAIAPRLDLAFPDSELDMEVSSPGLDRVIKDAWELRCFIGQKVKFYRLDTSDWSSGVLVEAGPEKVVLDAAEGRLELALSNIAKGKLCDE
jgi:ribosome maturation factor RimP